MYIWKNSDNYYMGFEWSIMWHVRYMIKHEKITRREGVKTAIKNSREDVPK